MLTSHFMSGNRGGGALALVQAPYAEGSRGLPGRRRPPPVGRAWDLARGGEILLVREAPSSHSETNGQHHGGN